MRPVKYGVVLLALLLAAMAMVPMGNATGTNSAAINEQNSSTSDPVKGNLFLALGLEKPEKSQGPSVISYSEAQNTIEKILEKGNISYKKENIIGLIEYNGSEILLIDRNETVLEIVDNGTSLTQRIINPVPLGKKEFTTTSVFVATSNGTTTGARKGVEISRIDVELPTKSGDLSIVSLQSITVWREDWWDYLSEKNLIHTEGTFYVNMGVSVTGISDNSYSRTAGPCEKCAFTHSASGAGSTLGQVTTSATWATIQAPTIKMSQDAWVSCDLNGDFDGNGHGDKWGAIGIGCLALP